jgi:hypothetical protein
MNLTDIGGSTQRIIFQAPYPETQPRLRDINYFMNAIKYENPQQSQVLPDLQ